MNAAPLQTYHRHQRFAHWLVVALVVVQFLSGDGMADAYADASRTGGWPSSPTATLHGAVGLAILTTMVWRISLRRRHGAPPPPADLSPTMQIISRANHYAFYVVLIAMPVVGAAAAFTMNDKLAILHAQAAPLLFLLIIAHVTGAMWHASKAGSPVLGRMLQPRTSQN